MMDMQAVVVNAGEQLQARPSSRPRINSLADLSGNPRKHQSVVMRTRALPYLTSFLRPYSRVLFRVYRVWVSVRNRAATGILHALISS